MDRFFFFSSYILKGWTKQKKNCYTYLLTSITDVCGGIKLVQWREENEKNKYVKNKRKKKKNIRNELHIYIPENIDTK